MSYTVFPSELTHTNPRKPIKRKVNPLGHGESCPRVQVVCYRRDVGTLTVLIQAERLCIRSLVNQLAIDERRQSLDIPYPFLRNGQNVFGENHEIG